MKKILFFIFCALLLKGDEFNDRLELLQKEFAQIEKGLNFQEVNLTDNVNVSKYTNTKSLNLFAFKKNYMMPFVDDEIYHNDRRKIESEFQVSIMVPLFKLLKADFFFGYTMHAVWQVYDKTHSSPFRDTNHEPQFFMLWKPDYKYRDFVLDKIYLGLIHQSNGQDVPLSRSWNRAETGIDFRNINHKNFSYSIHFWKRFEEHQPKSTPENPEGDDNPDLTDYIGTGYLRVAYKNRGYIFEITHQNNPFHYNINRGNTKVEAIIPSFNKHFKWFVKYFYGYGNTLIDYNVLTNRIGLGIYVGGLDF